MQIVNKHAPPVQWHVTLKVIVNPALKAAGSCSSACWVFIVATGMAGGCEVIQ